MASYHGEDMMGVGKRKRFMLSMKKAIMKHLADNGIKKQRVFLVGTGCSGVAMASTLSYMLGVRWGFIRKKGDTNNHSLGTVNEIRMHNMRDYTIAVDDFVSGGTTARTLYESFRYDALAVGHSGYCKTKEAIYNTVNLPDIEVITPPRGDA